MPGVMFSVQAAWAAGAASNMAAAAGIADRTVGNFFIILVLDLGAYFPGAVIH